MGGYDEKKKSIVSMVENKSSGRLATSIKTISGLEEIWDEVALLSKNPGWLQLSDSVLLCPCDAKRAVGVFPLDGEWVLGESVSVHMRHDGEGRWKIARIERMKDDSGIIQRREFAGTASAAGKSLIYEVFWDEVPAMSGHMRLVPRVSRFVGFGR